MFTWNPWIMYWLPNKMPASTFRCCCWTLLKQQLNQLLTGRSEPSLQELCWLLHFISCHMVWNGHWACTKYILRYLNCISLYFYNKFYAWFYIQSSISFLTYLYHVRTNIHNHIQSSISFLTYLYHVRANIHNHTSFLLYCQSNVVCFTVII